MPKTKRPAIFLLLLIFIGLSAMADDRPADFTAANEIFFDVQSYDVEGNNELPPDVVNSVLANYTGTNVSLAEIVTAAKNLQTAFRDQGFPQTSIAIAREQITNGVVTMNVFQTVLPQIVISGVRYFSPTNVETLPAYSPPPESSTNAAPAVAAATNTPPQENYPTTPATPEEMAAAQTALQKKLAELASEQNDHRIHVISTNAGPRFDVEHYEIVGNSVLTPKIIGGAITNIDGAFGTNVSFAGVRAVVEQLQQAYHDRGYITVAVTLPQQKLTNATVKVEVLEGRLAAINVVGNRYFSSNNIMRALPSLRTNILIDAPVLQAELNRANANQDRQIYPVIGPGPEPGTSELTLKVKDRLPLHGKIEFNNQNSPGTPVMRVNGSAVYGNLWQRDHSLGVQYGFSPEDYKGGNQWDFYDQPAVAYYSAFYRLPLGSPEAIGEALANNPGSFGYNEATRQFNLPPPSGQMELNLYASRATIDTGIETLLNKTLLSVPDVREIDQQQTQQGLTVNDDLGFQVNKSIPAGNFLSTISGGLDYKIYSQGNYQTNTFIFHEFTKGPGGKLIERTSYDYIPTPGTVENLDYLPLEMNYSVSLNNFIGPATVGLGASANLWYWSQTSFTSSDTNGNPVVTYKNGRDSLQYITGSTESSGHWLVLRPSYTQQIVIHTNWIFTMRADGQWASEPLISNEQFGIGGVNSVRGYHEGEVFGDEGWHVSLEQQTPPHVVGMIHGNLPLALQGTVFMDYATVYRIDPRGGPSSTSLWGTGMGVTASVGPSWQARLLFSVPLISVGDVSPDQPYFNFSLTAQF